MNIIKSYLFSFALFTFSVIAAEKINDPITNFEGIEIVNIPQNNNSLIKKNDNKIIFDKNKIYVIEFWATWCMPCINMFPHLSEIQKKYINDITIISFTKKDSLQSIKKIKDFIKDYQQNLHFIMAIDISGNVYKNYFDSLKIKSIPCSIIIKNNKIHWIGHPSLLETEIKKVILKKTL